jgi:hypothetical protein
VAALLLALLGLSVWSVAAARRERSRAARLEQRLDEQEKALAAGARTLAVAVSPRFVLRGQEPPGSGLLRANGAVNPVRLPASGDRVLVALSLPDHPAYAEYRLELIDRAGEVLWAAHRKAAALLGDAGTSLSFAGLAPGRYRLRIEGLHPDRSELLAEYLLEVER